MQTNDFPIFPLRVVLYPGGPLPLRIFEPRYVDMVSHCMRNASCFGVVGVHEDSQEGSSRVFGVGTAARIVDWDMGDDGLLSIRTLGEQRFRIESMGKKTDGLDLACVSWLEPEPVIAVPESLAYLSGVVMSLLEEFEQLYGDIPRQPKNAGWLGYRLAELLPLSIAQKQLYLELEDPVARLQQLARDVSQLRSDA
jgi:Lon protease-like protein